MYEHWGTQEGAGHSGPPVTLLAPESSPLTRALVLTALYTFLPASFFFSFLLQFNSPIIDINMKGVEDHVTQNYNNYDSSS